MELVTPVGMACGSGLRGAVSLDVAFESWRRRSIRVLRRQFGLMQTRIRI
jgi:hypothetical protein